MKQSPKYIKTLKITSLDRSAYAFAFYLTQYLGITLLVQICVIVVVIVYSLGER